MQAFHIMGSTNPAHAARLVSWLWRPRDQFLISFDNLDALTRFNAVAPRHDNVRSRLVFPVVWGGHGVARTMVSGIVELLEAPGWQIYTLLSDADVPIKPAAEIAEAIFRDYVQPGRIALNCDGYTMKTLPFPVLDESKPPMLKEMLPVRRDVRFLVHWQLEGDFESIFYSPIYDLDKRQRFHVTENTREKTLTIRPLLRNEIAFREAIVTAVPMKNGRNWHTLTRAACEWFLAFGSLPMIDAAYAHVMHSDESLFQSVLLHAESPWRERADLENLPRWANGSPDYVGDDLLPKFQQSACLFARKLEATKSDNLLAWLTEIHAGR